MAATVANELLATGLPFGRDEARPLDDLGLRPLLDKVPLGIVLLDAAGLISYFNATAPVLLGLQPAQLKGARKFSELTEQVGLAVRPIPGTNAVVETSTPDGRILEVESAVLTGTGIVLIIDDVTLRRRAERAKLKSDAQYQSLFDKAVCGIYRDSLDGQPMRCNPALAQLNGYTSEQEFIDAVSARPVHWYVDPDRRAQFMQQLERDGAIKDFVSEGYRHKTGETYWMMENAWLVRDDDGKPAFIEGTIQDATERMLALGMVERQVNLDMLTGAVSRFRFFNQLDFLTGANSKGCTLLSIDLDHFKEVNDMLGHEGGDVVLREAARRLQEACGSSGTLARIGGDEFAITIAEALDEEAAERFAARIVAGMEGVYEVGGRTVPMGVSVGVAMYPSLASTCDELLGNADKALYQAKANGRNGYFIFGAEARRKTRDRKALAGDLALAIIRDELQLFYQPIVFSDTGMVEGLEALVRWVHPERGLLSPAEFLPFAEEEGLMADIGTWVLRRACEQGVSLPSHVQIAVNVSADQFRSPQIVEMVRDALASSGLPAKRLTLEVTETVILSSESLATRVIGRLAEMGVGIALDDFGTAYSSLSYLQRFSFNKVKIDKSFVQGMFDIPANMAVVRAVIGIGRDLGIEVVAEGVEERIQVDRLMREGCRRMQGYYFSKPKPFVDIASELARSQLSGLVDDDEEFPTRRHWRR